MTQPVRILIVDDHAVVRKGLEALLEGEPGLVVVGAAGTAAEAQRMALETIPDVIIMDVRLPDASGIEACRYIRAQQPGIRVIMLTSYPDDQAALAAVMAGATGYLLKDLQEDALVRALHIVAEGGSLIAPDFVARLVGQAKRQETADPWPSLSDQERQILVLIAEGRTNREIGEALYLSEHTVKNYVSRLLEKLGLSRRSEAAAYLARHQMPPGTVRG